MSGGSWDYFYQKMNEGADKLKRDGRPERRAFGKRMEAFAKAMHEIEWVDSEDSSSPRDVDAIKEALILEELVAEARALVERLEHYTKSTA